MWQTLVPWFEQRWQSGPLFKTTTLSWWSSGHKYQREKKISENYLNHSISILSDNYHLSIEEETEMKGEYHWSHACSTVITSGIFTALPFFLLLFPLFFSAEGKKRGTNVEWWNYRHLRQHIHSQGRNMNKAGGWAVVGNKAERVISCRQITWQLALQRMEGSNQVAGGPLRYAGLQMAGVWQEAGLFVGINLHLRWPVNIQDQQHIGTTNIVLHCVSWQIITRSGKTSLNADP